MPPTLQTPRLVLRHFRGEDLDAYAAMTADAETMRHIGPGKPLTRGEAWRSIAGMLGHWELLGYGMWALERKGDGVFVGRAGFLNPPGWPGFEIGWMVGREHWGRGYATEAARVALDFAFRELGRDRVVSLIRPDNARSIRVAEKLGERPAGEVELLGGKALVYEVLSPPRG